MCKAERKAIIDEIKQKISDRLNSHLKAANQNEVDIRHIHLLHNETSIVLEIIFFEKI